MMSYIPCAHKCASIQVENGTSFVMCCVIQWFHKSGYINMCGAQMTLFPTPLFCYSHATEFEQDIVLLHIVMNYRICSNSTLKGFI